MTEPQTPYQATPEEYDEVRRLLDAANAYADEKSAEPQWTDMNTTYSRLRQEIENGSCFVIRNENNEICASISLSESDRYMWGDNGEDGQALYFHKLMKNPGIAPKGIGTILIKFAADETIARHKQYLRCDTKLSQNDLVLYYESLGLQPIRNVTYPTTGKEAVLLEADPYMVLERSTARA